MNAWGSIPEWVTAIASLGALVAAIAAALIARGLHSTESKRDETHAREMRAAQASKVNAWSCAEIPRGTTAPVSYGLVVRNASDSVVYDVHIESQAKGRDIQAMKLLVVPPGEYFVEYNDRNRYKWEFARGTSDIANEIRPIMKSAEIGVQSLSFRDSANVKWSRNELGFLSEKTAALVPHNVV